PVVSRARRGREAVRSDRAGLGRTARHRVRARGDPSYAAPQGADRALGAGRPAAGAARSRRRPADVGSGVDVLDRGARRSRDRDADGRPGRRFRHQDADARGIHPRPVHAGTGMKMWTVLGRSLARSRALFFGLACVLGGFQFLLVIMAGEVHQSQAFSQLTALVPPMIQQALGGLAFTSFPALVSFGYSHPIVVLALVEAAIFVGSEPAWEVEAGVLDLSMARPVPRRMMIARSALVVILTTAALATCMATATRIALHAFAPAGAPWPPVAVTVTLALNLGTVALCFGCLSLAVASIASRRG